ncbi:MAG: type IV pilus secretin PilQ [Magnetococcales bacterium]|nr:type IV pilus secretin PilQ [Magnetococcales bacterium]
MCQQKRKINNRLLTLSTGVVLLGGVVGLEGCIPTPGPVGLTSEQSPVVADGSVATSASAQSVKPVVPTATHIASAEAIETSQGVRIALASNGSLPYQVFALDAPSRLLLTFPGIRLEPAVQPRMVTLPGVTGIFPMEGADHGSQLEVVLREKTEYTVREREDGLDLTLFTKGTVAQGAQEGGVGNQNRPADSVQRIDAVQVAHSGTGTRIHLLGVGDLPEPQTFRLFDPPQIIFDFIGVTGPGVGREVVVTSQEIKSVRMASEEHKTRLVVDLADPEIQFRFDRNDPLPVIYLSRTGQEGVQPKKVADNVLPPVASVEAVKFTQQGETGLVTIQTGDDGVVLDSHREEKQLTLTLKGTHLAGRLSHQGSGGQRQDVQSFGGAVKTIDTFMEGKDTRIVVSLTSPTDQHEIIQQGKTILVRVKPATVEAGNGQPVYTGAKVSMDFKGIDIHNALRLLAELNHLNLLVADSVKGTVTMRLVAVPWDQALDLILESKGLGKELQGNVLRIAPLADLQTMADAQLLARESKQKLEPIITELIPVSFAKAVEIRDLLLETDQKSSGPATGNSAAAKGATPTPGREGNRAPRLLSASGSVVVDQRTNTLIVKDMAVNVAKVREMVAKLDKPIPQVLIEARIVEVGRDSALGLGINWGFNYKGSVNANMGVSSTATNAYLVQQNATTLTAPRPSMANGELASPNVAMLPSSSQMPSWVGSGVNSNLGVHLGSLSPLLDLDIELGALEVNGKAKTISSPRVLTANNKEATISQGVRQPYPTESESGGVTYQYIDAALSLKVTPHVTANGFITMEVMAKNNSIKGAVSPGAPPALNTREVETQALIKDGQTIVLGGIFQNSQNDSQRGIPELKDIPFLGWLFKNKVTSNNQTELLVFITPRIVNPS